MRGAIALLSLLVFQGCSGPPTQFYTLSPVAPPAAAARFSCDRTLIGVARVLLPETLDRQSMVRSHGPDRIDISNKDRWAAPLDGIIRHVLAEDLRNRLPRGRVLMPGDAIPPDGSVGLEINVQRFAGDTAGHVVLQADWTLLNRHGSPVLTRSETVSASAGSARTDAVVAAMSQAISELADRVVVVLRDCPLAKHKGHRRGSRRTLNAHR